MNDNDERFALRAIRRKRLFLWISIAGISIGSGLIVLDAVRLWRDPGFEAGPHAVIALLVLLNARQSLRQYRYARVLEWFMATGAR